ncbi:glycosyltransferase family 4 protein [Bacillus sp. SM-B1]|uniref:glycosyltransferase family 4 protein n=1 Tax=Bacillus sp. SM-B1 TaxID=2980102 RepID=UPI0029491D4E|nr:glycosyltransferase family 4 protein [Bacillus sp. SM-B1]MDV6038584.1 glycosyltransferase family 4 protein [Bacillus sp. SM-B1]
MKILHVVKTNEGANWAFTQAQWLFNNGVDIVTVLPSINGGMAEKYKAAGMDIIQGDFSLPVTKPWKILGRVKEIRNVVEEVRPDIIHCHFVTNIMMIRYALKKSKIPRLFQVPGPLHLESKFFKNVEISLANDNDFWAGSCKKTCEIYLDSGRNQDKVFLAYYGGYGGKVVNEYQNTKNKLHKEYNIPQDKVLAGMVSYFYKPKAHLFQRRGLKGHEDFIDAIALAQEKNPSIIGIVIGDAWGDSHKYVEKVKKYAEEKCPKGIIFTGFRKDLKEIYKELDLVIHPSHSENLGGAAESLAAGVPTISTNVGGFPDIVINGETGYSSEAKCPPGLAESIIKMIDDPKLAKSMAEKGRDRVFDLLNIEKTAHNMLLIYKKILSDRT